MFPLIKYKTGYLSNGIGRYRFARTSPKHSFQSTLWFKNILREPLIDISSLFFRSLQLFVEEIEKEEKISQRGGLAGLVKFFNRSISDSWLTME